MTTEPTPLRGTTTHHNDDVAYLQFELHRAANLVDVAEELVWLLLSEDKPRPSVQAIYDKLHLLHDEIREVVSEMDVEAHREPVN